MDVDVNKLNVVVEIVHTTKTDPAEEENMPLYSLKELNNNKERPIQSAAVWTHKVTLNLLKIYEDKLSMLETPKKKRRIWIAIADCLKESGTEVTPDQVRWKINALAKKYKQCLDSGQSHNFRYFHIMDNIYDKYNVDCGAYIIRNRLHLENIKPTRVKRGRQQSYRSSSKSVPENSAQIEMKKRRLTWRMESERFQFKIALEKQWLVYLKRQDLEREWRDDVGDRSMKIKENELEIRKQLIEIRETLELQRIEAQEKDQEEILQVEKEKLQLLKKLVLNKMS